MPTLFGAGDRTHGFVQARLARYQLSYSPVWIMKNLSLFNLLLTYWMLIQYGAVCEPPYTHGCAGSPRPCGELGKHYSGWKKRARVEGTSLRMDSSWVGSDWKLCLLKSKSSCVFCTAHTSPLPVLWITLMALWGWRATLTWEAPVNAVM